MATERGDSGGRFTEVTRSTRARRWASVYALAFGEQGSTDDRD